MNYMEETGFTNDNEYKTGGASRLAHGIRPGRKKKTAQTATDISIKKLQKELIANTNNETATDYFYFDKLREQDQLRYMNMETLARVMIFINGLPEDIDINNIPEQMITDEVNIVTQNVTNKETDQEGDIDIIKLRAFAQYVRYIKFYITVNNEN